MSNGNAGFAGIDFSLLHYLLWSRRDSPTTVCFSQATMAAELRIAASEMSRLMSRLTLEGRVAKTPTRGVYTIVDPAVWTADMVGSAADRVSR